MFFFFQNSKYKVINKDQWCNVLEFSRSILPDLSNYDEDGACKFSMCGYLIILSFCLSLCLSVNWLCVSLSVFLSECGV